MGEVNTLSDLTLIIKGLRAQLAELERRSSRAPTYTLATRPAATAVSVGALIFVSDAVDGQRFQGSDGSTWKTLG